MNELIEHLIAQAGQILLGKEQQIKLALACMLAKGHLLIEDLPGMGKTTLAHCLSAVLGLRYDRVQFTSDLLPADILGASIFDKRNSAFKFHPGPVFTQILLADEINRTTPKTQSALLEAMEEYQVTIDGECRPLPEPFFVIATQNPINQSGTFPLPESQLDRFLMRISLGYPNPESEMELYKGVSPRERLKALKPLIDLEQFFALQAQVHQVKASDSLLSYLQRLVQFTRDNEKFSYAISPRGALAWLQSAKAWALVDGRGFVIPEDIQAVCFPVVAHRIKGSMGADQLIRYLMSEVDVIGK